MRRRLRRRLRHLIQWVSDYGFMALMAVVALGVFWVVLDALARNRFFFR